MATYDEQILRSSFKKFFGVDQAYDFQIEVAQHLLEGRSVVLQAPTGAGKTFTALFPFLFALFQNLEPAKFPRKLIYSVERRILVNNFEAEVKNRNLAVETGVLTGERSEEPEMLKPLLFTTIDQTLSSFLLRPYSLSNRQANINAGAIVSSYLVFDEAHLFDPERALPTLMWMLKTLKGVTPTLLMTATFSRPVLEELATLTGGVVVTVPPEQVKKIPAQATKQRFFNVVDQFLSAEAVLKAHQSRSIVVCNTVDHAQQIYEDLLAQKDSETRLLMLHARFWQQDRKQKEKELMELFGPRNADSTIKTGSAILVATQVIEVGVDITCENLHTDLAPANTILQRAGRCARHPNETGTVHIYQVEKKAPYFEDEDLFDLTWEGVKELAETGQPVRFEQKQALIEQVHAAKDKLHLQKIKDQRLSHQAKIEETINLLVNYHLKDLIRDSDSRSFLVHNSPETLRNPYDYESFSVFDGSFRGKLKQIYQAATEMGLDWSIKFPQPVDTSEDQQEIEKHRPVYQWPNLTEKESHQWHPLVVINPALVSYDKERGFRFVINTGEPCNSPEIARTLPERVGYNYRLETYAEHIKNVNWAYKYFKFEDEVAFAAAELEKRLGNGIPAGQIDQAIRLSFVFHDAGKLTEGWQSVVHKWQQVVGPPDVDPQTMLAHTYLDRQKHGELQKVFEKQGNKRPPHAVEGALIATKFLHQTLGAELSRPVISAIARHHAPAADKPGDYLIHKSALQAIQESLTIIERAQPWNLSADLLLPAPKNKNLLADKLLVRASSELELITYMLIIRVLRIADQRSFEFYKVHNNSGE